MRKEVFRWSIVMFVVLTSIGLSIFLMLHADQYRGIHGLLTGLLVLAWLGLLIQFIISRKKGKFREHSDPVSLMSQYFEYSNDMLCVANHQGYFEFLNPEWEKTLGYSRGELMSKKYLSLVHPDDLESTLKAATELSFQKKVFGFSNRYLCKDGSYRWLEWHSYPKDNLIFAAVRDITERKAIEERLEQLHTLQAAIFDNAGYAIILTDHQGAITSANREAEKLLGYHAGELTGLNVVTSLHVQEELVRQAAFLSEKLNRPVRPDFEVFIAEAYAINPMEFEWSFLRKDGTRFPVLLKVTSLIDSKGDLRGFMGIAADLTEKKKDLEAIQQREKIIADERNMLRALIDNIPDIVYVKDTKSRFLVANVTLANILGRTPESIPGLTDLDLIPRERSNDFYNDEKVLFQTGNSILNKEEVLYDLKGNEIVFQSTKVPLRDSNGMITGLVGTGHIITERKKAEEEIKKLNKELERMVEERTARLQQVNTDLESFAYSVSHDLRSPLRHVDGFMQMMYQNIPEPNEKVRNYATKINAVLKRMAVMIDDLLAFSRLGRKELNVTRVNLNTVVRNIIDHYAHETASRNITWTINELPVVKGDQNLLHLAFENLLSNAIKYTSGISEARIEIGSRELPGNYSEIYISDNGVGFDMAYYNKLFGVFQRLHSGSQYEGTGIGLANVKQIVLKHKGSVWAEGKVNEGAVFYIALPLADESQPIKDNIPHGH
ncbi:MAG: PAS domain S-box protein [Bacteroidales bacterium]|nr:PAS domain S-box protein [Bacteroidales bacterium]